MLLRLLFWAFLLKMAFSDGDDFTYNGFKGVNLSLDGLAGITSDGLLSLTNSNKHQHDKGHAFFPAPQRFKRSQADNVVSFTTTFIFAIFPELPMFGGAGFAFVLSPSKDLTQASPYYFLGVFNMTKNGNASNHILAVEFDTWYSPQAKDINGNHVGIDINGCISNKSAPAGFHSDDGKIQDLFLLSGLPMQVWIEYNGTDMQLNVTLAPLWTPKPNIPLLSSAINLSSIILDHMYVGFSASVGVLSTYYYILGWSFTMDGKAPELNLSSLPPLPENVASFEKKNQNILSLWLPPVLSVLVLIIAAGATVLVVSKKKFSELHDDWELDFKSNRFSYKQLYKATRGFKDECLLGIGGFGKVYRGVLPASNIEVAVKRVSHESNQGVREFVAETVSLGKLRHRNLVQLLGYCRRKRELLLVYEYMSNGSLDGYLFSKGKNTLGWNMRFQIIKGVASGLLYLHEGWDKVVIHRDIKTSNVLLDSEMNGRLGDFGLARLYDHGDAPQTTHVVGTLGFLAPELAKACKFTTMSDVFSFGVFLLEVVCGRRAIDPHKEGMEQDLVDWVFANWKKGTIYKTKDPRLGEDYVLKELDLVFKLGLFCSHPLPSARPSMRQVTQFLNGDAPLPPLAQLISSCTISQISGNYSEVNRSEGIGSSGVLAVDKTNLLYHKYFTY
ncbi:putative protein kinase RLK-Pelle-L-LEC family [Dioscorea sansibarensis]